MMRLSSSVKGNSLICGCPKRCSDGIYKNADVCLFALKIAHQKFLNEVNPDVERILEVTELSSTFVSFGRR